MDELYIKLRRYAQDPTNYVNPYIVATPSRFPSSSTDFNQTMGLQYATSPLENFTVEFKDPLELTSDFFMYDYDCNDEPTTNLASSSAGLFPDRSFSSSGFLPSSFAPSFAKASADMPIKSSSFTSNLPSTNSNTAADLFKKGSASLSPSYGSSSTICPPAFEGEEEDKENPRKRSSITQQHLHQNTSKNSISSASSKHGVAGNLKKKRKSPLSSLNPEGGQCNDFPNAAQKSVSFDDSQFTFTSSGRMSVKKAKR